MVYRHSCLCSCPCLQSRSTCSKELPCSIWRLTRICILFEAPLELAVVLNAISVDLATGTATDSEPRGRLLLQRQALQAFCQLAVVPGCLQEDSISSRACPWLGCRAMMGHCKAPRCGEGSSPGQGAVPFSSPITVHPAKGQFVARLWHEP